MAFADSVVPRLLKGRLALVTGAGQGNGRTLALGLAQAGARVIATDMNGSTVEETGRLVRHEGGDASVNPCLGFVLPPNNALHRTLRIVAPVSLRRWASLTTFATQ
jgi:NAD(P)-dependent dehydrogenase (short-subunit alcohol dehydrogenase family)